MITSPSHEDVVANIYAGNYTNDELDQIRHAAITIKAARAEHFGPGEPPQARLRVGDRVALASNTRPKYLVGLKGTVTKVNQTRAKVKFDDDELAKLGAERSARWRGSIACPFNMLERIES